MESPKKKSNTDKIKDLRRNAPESLTEVNKVSMTTSRNKHKVEVKFTGGKYMLVQNSGCSNGLVVPEFPTRQLELRFSPCPYGRKERGGG